MMRRWKIVAAGGLALGLLTAAPAAAQDSSATQFMVDTTSDTTDASPGDGQCADADGACSLRAAVQEANATGDQVEIVLDRARYDLTITGAGEDAAATGDLDVTGDIVLRGMDATVELTGLGDRSFDVTDRASLKVDRLTVQNGAPPATESGGAFRSSGRLRLDEVVALYNTVQGDGASGGAIANLGGRLAVERSLLSLNSATRAGGAIEADAGTTVVRASRLTRNTTGDGPGNGGALHLTGEGTVDVLNSLVTDNVAAAEGGGLWNSAVGTMTVDGSFVERNVANGDAADSGGGGLYNDGGTLTVSKSEVNDNTATVGSGSGGGILNNGGMLDVDDTTIRGNVSARAGGGIETVAGTVDLHRVFLNGNTTGDAPGNGGGLHVTGAATVDVRNTIVGHNTAAAEGGGLWNSADGTMTVTGSRLEGNVANGTDADSGGGGLYNDGGTVTVVDSTIRDNAAPAGSGSGGAILNNGGVLDVDDARIRGNSSARAGGGIETVAGTVTLDGVVLSNNETGAAPGNGGGLHVSGAATVEVNDSVVSRNTAANEGGGLWNSSVGTMTVDGSRIANNAANGDASDAGGGGLFNQGSEDGTSGGTLTVTDSVIADNAAIVGSGSGGGVLNEQGTLTVTDSVIANNASARAGGGIEVVGGADAVVGRTELRGVNLRHNSTGTAPGNGGGLHVTAAGEVVIDDSKVTDNNAANEGGGLWNSATGQMTVTDTPVVRNTVGIPGNGPNVYQDEPVASGMFTVDGTVIPPGPNTLEFPRSSV